MTRPRDSRGRFLPVCKATGLASLALPALPSPPPVKRPLTLARVAHAIRSWFDVSCVRGRPSLESLQ